MKPVAISIIIITSVQLNKDTKIILFRIRSFNLTSSFYDNSNLADTVRYEMKLLTEQ